MAGVTQSSMTIAEFDALDEDTQKRHELVRGELIQTMPPLGEHSIIQFTLSGQFAPVVKALDLVGATELDCDLSSDPADPIIRRPDLALHPRADFDQRTAERVKRFQGGPMLVIEIASPGQSFDELAAKLEDFFAAGTQEAWLVSPTRRVIQQLTNAGIDIHEYRLGTTLTSVLLPDFGLKVDEVFGK